MGVTILLVLSLAWIVVLGFFEFMSSPMRPLDPSQNAVAIVVWLGVQGAIDFAVVKVVSWSGVAGAVRIMVAVCAVSTGAVLLWSLWGSGLLPGLVQ